jgi:hypothetical protein
LITRKARSPHHRRLGKRPLNLDRTPSAHIAFTMLGGRTPSRPVVEHTPRADVFELHRRGAIPFGTRRITLTIGGGILDAPQAVEVELATSWRNALVGRVTMFSCPRCAGRCRHLYLLGGLLGGSIACRRCHQLVYSGRVHRASAAVDRVIRLRRRLGAIAMAEPFSPLPLRKSKLSRAIERAEEEMIARLHGSLRRVTAAVAARRAGVREHRRRSEPTDLPG